MSRAMFCRLAGVALLGVSLSGCAYDYTQHTDRVGYSAGDAVKANLAQQAVNPYTANARTTSGLGKNGNVIPVDTIVTPSQ